MIKFDCYNLTGDELDIKVGVDNMKLEEQNTKTGISLCWIVFVSP